MFFGWFMGVFGLFLGWFKDTSRLFQECFNVILEYAIEGPRVFLEYFFPIELIWVTEMTFVHKSKHFLTKIS